MALFPMEPMMAVPPMEPMMALSPMEPMMALSPMEPLLPLAPLSMTEPLLELATPMVPLVPFAPVAPFPGQGTPPTPRPAQRTIRDAELERWIQDLDRAEAARQRALDQSIRQAEMQDRQLQRQLEQQLSQTQRAAELADRQAQRQIEQQLAAAQRAFELKDREIQRDNERLAQQVQRQLELQERQVQREVEQSLRSMNRADMAITVDAMRSLGWNSADARVRVPAAWAQDVADSSWQAARELFNRGEYGQAAQAFRALPTRFPNSPYAAEAAYYQAFSLFRIGGTNDLKEALTALEASKARYPSARSRTEATNLATRIRGVLAARGDQQAAAELSRTANQQPPTCDREEQAVQAEAMNALSRSDAGNVNELITRVLARKDECAVPLRRTAVFLVGNRRDAQAITILAGVARNDPSVDVRVEAISVIGRLPNEEGVPVLEELARSDDERVQRAAVRALVRHPSARARASVRALIERDDVSERVKSEALSAFNSDQATADDVAWLRALYGKSTTTSMKARTLSAIVRVGGPEVDQWLVTIARDEAQPSEIRSTAMRRIGQTMSVADLGKLYDGATTQRFRSEIISVLGKRKEDAATDKLIDIIKNGTDPSLRSSAIRAVNEKDDPRARQLLLDIINK
jgi:HEAT repeat protein